MRIAFISRSSLFDDPGGDTIQMEQTAQYLKTFGVNVDIIANGQDYSAAHYDLLHFFNLIRPGEVLPHLKSGVPAVISPIYVDYSFSDQNARKGISANISKVLDKNKIEYIKAGIRFIKGKDTQISKEYFLNGHKRSMQKVLNQVRYILPNSESEYSRIKTDFQMNVPYAVIPNGSTAFFKYEGNQRMINSILCVARIEPRKNQLNLIKAINASPELSLTIIGDPGKNSFDYYEECKSIAGERVQFISGISQSSLIEHYHRSHIHVLASWFETTGLSSLEAGTSGCQLVISKYGDASDYFKDFVEYCDPGNVESIRGAIMAAIKRPLNNQLSEFLLKNYTWQVAAEKTLEVYRKVLK
jgi:glycosyltransferase involved in cell wall biosynthesis